MAIDFDPSKLKNIRKRLDLTQSAFAKEACVSQSLIAKIEAGRIDPTFSNVKKIAEAAERLSHREERKAEEVMTRDLMSARPSETIADIVALMSRRSISQIPVMEGNKVVGLVSESGLLEARMKKSLAELKVRDVMSEAPPIVAPNTPVSAVMGLMRYFPAVLVTKDGTIAGIITKSDLIKSALK